MTTTMETSQIAYIGAAVLMVLVVYALWQRESLAKYVLFCWGALCFFYAGSVLGGASPSVHEIQGGIALLIGTLAWGIAAMIDTLDRLRRGLRQRRSTPPPSDQVYSRSFVPLQSSVDGLPWKSNGQVPVSEKQLHDLDRALLDGHIDSDDYQRLKKMLGPE